MWVRIGSLVLACYLFAKPLIAQTATAQTNDEQQQQQQQLKEKFLRIAVLEKAQSATRQGARAHAKGNNILALYSKAAGDRLSLLNDVHKSEAATNTGNKALAALLLKDERIYADTLESVDVCTKQCSVGVTARESWL